MLNVVIIAGMGLVLIGGGGGQTQTGVISGHGFAMHGQPKYGPNFSHFEYADPKAPKGGSVTFSAIGTFDNLNPFILKGISAAGASLMFDTLTVNSSDEAFTEYGSVAQTIEFPEDRSWVRFILRPEATFHDGSPITADDVVFSFEILTTKGHPFYRSYYASVSGVEKEGERQVKFTFNQKGNRELPLIMGQMPILSKAYWSTREFDKATMETPLGSGPYTVDSFEAGRSITYKRVKGWWGEHLPINKGRYNYDFIKYKYYKDSTVALEAFKAGEYDFRVENSAKNWATAYDFPAVKRGAVKRDRIKDETPKGMQGFVFNTRRSVFKDPKVRQAIAYAFDYEWMNKILFYGQYNRTKSYFEGSELASRGLPQGEELAILKKFKGKIPEEVFTTPYEPPATDGSGNIRDNLRVAAQMLKAAGWTVDRATKKLVNPHEKGPMAFEILLVDPAFERIVLPFKEQLGKLGIDVKVRTVDPSQYQKRVEEFDFDMIVATFDQSLSPGNEQRDFWSSAKRNVRGSRNYAGVNDPVVDQLVELVITAPDRQSLIARTRALDRVLLWGHYVVPQWHSPVHRVAYWDIFGRPKIAPKYALGVMDTWWVDPVKAAALKR